MKTRVNLIHMTGYPNATVTPLSLSDERFWDLEQRLMLIYIGKTFMHVSRRMASCPSRASL